MSYYERIYEYAADNYGLISSAEAKVLDVPNVELVKLSHRGRLVRIGHGVYRISHYIPTPLDRYAEAVALTGENTFIYGESVLAMHGLAFVNPTAILVATTKRTRKSLPVYIKIVNIQEEYQIINYEGIPTQNVADAILVCKATVMTDRLLGAIDEAYNNGLITQEEATIAREKLLNE
jgi:predicted transcriptional regulator of viral defense system